MKKILAGIGLSLVVLIVAGLAFFFIRQKFANAQLEEEWQSGNGAKINDLGTTNKLEILPLFEKNGDSSTFQVGHGVSYLVKTDQISLLVDVGFIPNKTDPSPVTQNMDKLGITWDEIDAILISHPHPDHLGGTDAWLAKTISFGSQNVDLSGKNIYAPIPLTYPGVSVTVTKDPTILGPGVATIGVLSYPEVMPVSVLNPKGYEQSLAVNVTGKGILLITGCGHPTLERLVLRAEEVFGQPVIGIVGGLHYGDASAEQLAPHIEFLKERKPLLVSLSPHDSLPSVIEAFRSAFPGAYQEIKIGQPITFQN
jgi:7,8-dihydropterin-6-yl-methyl-4-(beta-D-ribofuranosyl)aminobenzene 5'-phosphate synthase